MHLDEWTGEQIEILIHRYRERKVAEGGQFNLAELLREKSRRNGAGYSAPRSPATSSICVEATRTDWPPTANYMSACFLGNRGSVTVRSAG